MENLILKEISRIHPSQPTIPATILMAIRARMEFKAGVENRIGKCFPDGSRGVLMVGKAGTGKTSLMQKIYHGLGMDDVDYDGNALGTWISSADASTGVGMYQLFEHNSDSIIFADELSLDTKLHVKIIKQIANGQIVRPRHGNIEPINFTGLLIAATNAIKVPNNTKDVEHVLAVLDRFMVVKTKKPKISASETMRNVLDGIDMEPEEPNWKTISRAIVRPSLNDLSGREKILLKRIWAKKARQILDPTRAQYRNVHAAIDIFLFLKRITGVKDINDHKDIAQFAAKMIDDCIIFNPVNILWLEPIEEIIYESIERRKVTSMSQILIDVKKAGLDNSRQHVHKVIDKMLRNRLIWRPSHGNYSTSVVLNHGMAENSLIDDQIKSSQNPILKGLKLPE